MVNKRLQCTHLSCLREYVVPVTACEPVQCTGNNVALFLPLRMCITPKLKLFIYQYRHVIDLQIFGSVDPLLLSSYSDYENSMPVVTILIISPLKSSGFFTYHRV